MADDKLSILKDQLYMACEDRLETDGNDAKAYEKYFTQQDLLALDVIPANDTEVLLAVIQALTAEFLFQSIATSHGTAWRLRSEAEAAKYTSLNSKQMIIYAAVDAAGADGIWLQDLRKKTGINNDVEIRKIVADLEQKLHLINHFSSVENPLKKRYIKAGIEPSIKATGGAWFAEGDLDESFVETLMKVIYNMVKKHSSYASSGGRGFTRSASASPVLPKKGIKMGSQSAAATAARGKKRTADAADLDDNPFTMKEAEIVSSSPDHKSRKTVQPALLPLPAGYMGYLTAPDITKMVSDLRASKVKLKESDIKQLLDVLVFDNQLEEIKVGNRLGYRITQISKQNPQDDVKDVLTIEDGGQARKNGLTTAPCGRCPVFDLCEEGGPVWAGGCEYFDRWLAQ